ncbi:F-box protein CPR1-like [Camellia sinensis]|uniref:F-box protein CPR1-like n=1 Tax=Camellia sinensis TaxID=4442 RepID=UPI001036EEF7|nr:F-box protein CPR1-like [Camellia sinensis]
MAFSHETPSCGLVVIGSFRSKTWIVVHFPSHVSSVKLSPVVNENLHWFASKESWGHFFAPHQIVYFNLRKNIFKKLPMPKPKDGDGDILLGLGVLDGCLCMVRSCEHPTNHVDRVEVLVMKKYGIKESWTTMLILSNLPNLRIYDNVVPLCFTKNGEILMKIGWNHVRAYNPNDNS